MRLLKRSKADLIISSASPMNEAAWEIRRALLAQIASELNRRLPGPYAKQHSMLQEEKDSSPGPQP